MATLRDKKHDMYLNFHGHLNGTGDFTPKERKFFKWFMVACVAGVAMAYLVF